MEKNPSTPNNPNTYSCTGLKDIVQGQEMFLNEKKNKS